MEKLSIFCFPVDEECDFEEEILNIEIQIYTKNNLLSDLNSYRLGVIKSYMQL